VLIGTAAHLGENDRDVLTVSVLCTEAMKTSEIEGELLNRDSVQSSIRRQFGLTTDPRRIGPAEQGIAELMVDLYRHFAEPLSDEVLFRWHGLLTQGRRDIQDFARYRTHAEAMQVVSGPTHARRVHFEAPPSEAVPREMAGFIAWFNRTAPGGSEELAPLARAGIAHLYFVSIHPFEDGNGRIGRAISEKALAQGLGQPSLTALAATIEKRRKDYYDALAAANTGNEVTQWLLWFAETVLEAQAHTQGWIRFLIEKAKFLDGLRGKLNARQEKVLLRMSREGPEGFTGGLSAGNYARITGAPSATSRRDLGKLVELGALIRTGERKGTRYWLPFANLGCENPR
jgi:Fic family protein